MSEVRPGQHLARAWVLAEQGRDRTNPNPFVGCVLERDGQVVGEGWTQPAGGDHAEIVALTQAGVRARGATAWVTLEPCNHVGRTGPCAVALRDAGVARVVIGMEDPSERAGGGAAWLADHGMTVEHWPWQAWVRHQNEVFVTNVERNRPWVTLKLAAARDGRLTSDGRWITGPAARAEVHRLRARADAVLVGSGTVLADDPRLDVRDAPLLRGQPRPIVVDRRGRIPPDARVVRPGSLIVTAEAADLPWQAELEERGAQILRTDDDPSHWLPALCEHGVWSVLAEPGPTLAAALCRAGLVDDVVLHQARGDGPGALPAPLSGHRWRHLRTRPIGDDVETVLRPRSI